MSPVFAGTSATASACKLRLAATSMPSHQDSRSDSDRKVFPIVSRRLYHQHNPAFRLDECVRIMHRNGINLFRSNRLAVFSYVEFPAVYNLRDLLRSQSPVAFREDIEYSLLDLHRQHIQLIFSRWRNCHIWIVSAPQPTDLVCHISATYSFAKISIIHQT